ncbi:MAG: ABC transporter substrate-binding protein [Bacilli bacterium]|nr:ABC transporter substrate-binding protein [Bacilli bacterium]
MKKIFISIIIIFIIVFISIFTYNKHLNKNNNNLTHVKVAEVAHSVFYAPQYLADSLGYFKDEGLDVDINLTAGADAVTSAVLSGDADIGFCGTEATIYVIA